MERELSLVLDSVLCDIASQVSLHNNEDIIVLISNAGLTPVTGMVAVQARAGLNISPDSC